MFFVKCCRSRNREREERCSAASCAPVSEIYESRAAYPPSRTLPFLFRWCFESSMHWRCLPVSKRFQLLSHRQEKKQRHESCTPTIRGKGMETPLFKVLEQKFRAQVCCHPIHAHSQEHQTQGCDRQTNELEHFEQRGSPDERRSQQEEMARGILMV